MGVSTKSVWVSPLGEPVSLRKVGDALFTTTVWGARLGVVSPVSEGGVGGELFRIVRLRLLVLEGVLFGAGILVCFGGDLCARLSSRVGNESGSTCVSSTLNREPLSGEALLVEAPCCAGGKISLSFESAGDGSKFGGGSFLGVGDGLGGFGGGGGVPWSK